MSNVNDASTVSGSGNGTVKHPVPRGLDTSDEWQKLRLPSPLQTDTIGSIGELLVAIELLERGYEPYFPLPNRNGKYDCLALDRATGEIVKISVKSTTSDKGGSHFRGAVSTTTALVKWVGPKAVRPFRQIKKKRYPVR